MSVTAMIGGAPDQCQAHIACAIALTKRLHTTLTGLLAMPDPANAVMYFVAAEAVMAGASSIDAVTSAQDETAEALKEVFDKEVKAAGSWLNAEFVRKTGPVHAYASAAATLSDALVFPRGAANGAHALNPAFEHVLMDARLPMVIASADGKVDGPVIIAWDGSPQAARAVRLHLPLLLTYKKAIIAQQPDKLRREAGLDESSSPEALSDWLHEERLETDIINFDGPVSEGLLSTAQAHGSGLIIMGAYGHNRMGEMLFGGTSRALLNNEAGPALALAH